MPAVPTSPNPPLSVKVVQVRLPEQLHRDLEGIARRDCLTLAAAARRAMAIGVRVEGSMEQTISTAPGATKTGQ